MAQHPAEHDAVERGDAPTSRACPARPCGAKVARWRSTVLVVRPRSPRVPRGTPARPGRAAASRRAAAAAGPRSTLLDPPEVQGVADVEPARVPAAAAQADAADRRSSQPRTRQASGKEYQPVVPADALDHPPHAPRACGRRPGALVDVEAAAGPVRVGGQRVGRGAGHGGRRPAGRDGGVLDALHGQADGVVEPEQPLGRIGDVLRRCRARRRRRCCAATPPAARAMPAGTGVIRPTQWLDSDGREQRHREDPAPRQAGHRGVPLHHLGVAHDVGAADVEAAVHRRPAGSRSRRGSAARPGRRSAGSGCAPSAA